MDQVQEVDGVLSLSLSLSQAQKYFLVWLKYVKIQKHPTQYFDPEQDKETGFNSGMTR